jgi:outer membrane protein TolC
MQVAPIAVIQEVHGQASTLPAQTRVAAVHDSIAVGKVRELDAVLVSDSRSYNAQISQAQAELSERLALVLLYHATGGGWQTEPTAQP